MFTSELLNNNVPIHVIQALLGHAGARHGDGLRQALLRPADRGVPQGCPRDLHSDFHGPNSLRAPTMAEWREFAAACNVRDMGTHLSALPTGDHCSRGLV
jgi:hypothetical protein